MANYNDQIIIIDFINSTVSKLESILGSNDSYIQFFNLLNHKISTNYPDKALTSGFIEFQNYVDNDMKNIINNKTSCLNTGHKNNKCKFSESIKRTMTSYDKFTVSLIESMIDLCKDFDNF